MTDRELMQQALDALDKLLDKLNADICDNSGIWDEYCDGGNAMQALRARLAQPEQEPLAWWQPNEYKIEKSFSWHKKGGFIKPLYPAPPQREWQGLTDEEYTTLMQQADHDAAKTGSVFLNLRYAIEAKLKEKNIG